MTIKQVVRFFRDDISSRQGNGVSKEHYIEVHEIKHCSNQHISGIFNSIYDALSRFDGEKSRSLAPEAAKESYVITDDLWKVFDK